MSKKERPNNLRNRTPKNHSKPAIQAAVAVYYAAKITGEDINLGEHEEMFREAGVSVDVLSQYINGHNREIKEIGFSDQAVELLTEKPKLSDPGTRRKKEQKLEALPDVECSECGHKWKSRSRYGRPVVRCHKCGARVKAGTEVFP